MWFTSTCCGPSEPPNAPDVEKNKAPSNERRYASIGGEGVRMLEKFSDRELEVVGRFLADAIERQEKYLAAVLDEEQAPAG